MMVPRSLHRCIDCAAPLFVVHDAVPPACLLPEDCSAHGFPGETPRETRRLSSSSSSSPAASGTSVSQIALGMPAAFSVAANSEDRNEGGDSVKVPPHAPQLTSASSGVPTPHAEPRDTAQVQTPEAVSGFSRAPVSLSSPRAPSGESASSPSLQDSFVLLSPLPGTLAPAVGHREEAVSASSPVAATAHSADGSVGPSAFSQALAPEGLSRHSSEETHRQRFVARLAEGENWTQFVLDDAALCSKCFSSAVDQLEKQLEDERALLRQYTRALERLKKLRRAEAARRCRQERRERVDKGQALCQLDSRGGRKSEETNTADAPSTRGDGCGSSCVQEDERTALDTTEQSPLRGDQGDHEQVGRNDTPQEGQLRLAEDLRAAQQEYEEAEDEEERLLEEMLSLNLLQRELWHLSSARQGQIARHEEATAAMLRQREYVSGQLERLKRLNVMNDAFHIWTDSALPSINSCRIGRVSSPATPSWAEINSGWGHMCLLLDVLFRKVYVHPTHYRLVPRGPFSCLISFVLGLPGAGGKTTSFCRFKVGARKLDLVDFSTEIVTSTRPQSRFWNAFRRSLRRLPACLLESVLDRDHSTDGFHALRGVVVWTGVILTRDVKRQFRTLRPPANCSKHRDLRATRHSGYGDPGNHRQKKTRVERHAYEHQAPVNGGNHVDNVLRADSLKVEGGTLPPEAPSPWRSQVWPACRNRRLPPQSLDSAADKREESAASPPVCSVAPCGAAETQTLCVGAAPANDFPPVAAKRNADEQTPETV